MEKLADRGDKETQNPITTLRPPWLGIARAAWVSMAIAAILLATLGLAKALGEPLPRCTTAGAACLPWMVSQEDITLAQQAGLPHQLMKIAYFSGLIFPKVAFGLVGLLIFWRRSQDWVAQLLSLMLILFALEGIASLGALQPPADFLYALSTLIFLVLPFIFPNGRFVPGWIAWPAIPIIFLSALSVFAPRLGLPFSEGIYAGLILIPYLIWFLLAAYSLSLIHI